MASGKTYNAIDCKQQLVLIETKKGEFGGYKQDLLVNSLSEIEVEFYVCTKCNELMRNACQIGEEQTPVCETCAREKEVTQAMLKSRKKIRELRAKCPLEGRGCLWSEIIGEIEAHLDLCPEFIVSCSNECKVIMKRSELENHLRNECQNRKINCEYCQVEMRYEKLENHFKSCPEFPLLCSNECMENLTRKEIESHIENECPNTILICMNKCGMKLKRCTMPNHCENECQHRNVNCKHCRVVSIFKEVENHHKTCPEFPLLCPNECMENLTRKEIESHIENECPNTILDCPYKKMECEEMMKRSEVEEHENKFEIKHLGLNMKYFSNKVERMEIKLHRTESDNRLYKMEIEKNKEKIEDIEKNFKSQEQAYKTQIEKLEDKYEKLRRSGRILEINSVEIKLKVKHLCEKILYPDVLNYEIDQGFLKNIIDGKTGSVIWHEFWWKQQRFGIVFEFARIPSFPLITATIQIHFDNEKIKMIRWPLKAKFKLTFVDNQNFHNSHVYESNVHEIKPIITDLRRRDKAKRGSEKQIPPEDIVALAEIPRELILEERLRNINDTISFILQVQDMDASLM